MSKRINVNPDHYKVAGRERQGEDVVHRVEKQAVQSEEQPRAANVVDLMDRLRRSLEESGGKGKGAKRASGRRRVA